jgi:pilus assembly protein CpaF
MVTLLLTEKGGESKQLNFDKDEVTIGRVQGNDVVLPKGNVSKRHCRIMLQGGRFAVEDLKSTNGTYINGRKIGETTSVVGTDKIYVGDFVIKIENAGGEAAAPPGPPEAGSLSSALPRRPPPPPAPGRATSTMRAVDDEQMSELRARGPGRNPLPPPPPPRRDPTPMPPAQVPSSLLGDSDGLPDLEVGPPSPSDVDMDEEALPSRPRLSVPPLKSPRPLTSEDADRDDEVRTSHRERGAMRARELPRDGHRDTGAAGHAIGSAEGLASWLQDLVSDPDTQAVYVNGPNLEVQRGGRREPADLPAGASLEDAVRALAARGNPRPAGDTRVINVLLPENARLAAIFPPVASDLSVTLQKLAPAGRSLQALVDGGAMPEEARELIEACISTRRNILIGGDGRALEQVLEAVAGSIPAQMRVVSLAAGLSVPDGASWIKLATETRVSDIVMAASSLRPDYLVVEVTAPPLATDVLGQCVLGQEGTIVAVAARSAADALQRLSALAGPALGGVAHARELAATAFDVVMCAGTQADGSVRLLEIGEPHSDGSGQLSVTPIVSFAQHGGGHGRSGRYDVSAGTSRLASTLGARGIQLSPALARD